MRAPTATTLRQAWETWLAGAREGSVRNRSGDAYKPSVLRGYETSMRLRVLNDLGGARLSDITRVAVQDLVDEMLAAGKDASTIRNTLMPLRAIFRRALARGEVALNPVAGVELPAVRGRRDRIASPAEADALIVALPAEDQAVWATAFYAGLRLGELWALRNEDVDLEAGVIRVERSWDRREGVIEPKSRAGRRAVPIVAALRSHLAARKLKRETAGALFFGEGSRPFNRDGLVARAGKAWKAAGFAPIGLHECRHTFASILIAAGVNAKALSSYLGHSSIQITLDRYGHLMPGNEDEAVALVDAYLERATILRQSDTGKSGFQRSRADN
jgi:integrase